MPLHELAPHPQNAPAILDRMPLVVVAQMMASWLHHANELIAQ
jgi:hypothetical protein